MASGDERPQRGASLYQQRIEQAVPDSTPYSEDPRRERSSRAAQRSSGLACVGW
jgi:hypothetical protein